MLEREVKVHPVVADVHIVGSLERVLVRGKAFVQEFKAGGEHERQSQFLVKPDISGILNRDFSHDVLSLAVVGLVVENSVTVVIDGHFQTGHFTLRDDSQRGRTVDRAHVKGTGSIIFHGHLRTVVFHGEFFLQHGLRGFEVFFADLYVNTVAILEVATHVIADGTKPESAFLGTQPLVGSEFASHLLQ